MRTVHVEEASLKTCSVEVKALVINKKQMTLSVFRQLPRKHIIEPGVGLRGEPWGLVNYFWDGCGGGEGKHLHVVWQDGSQLCRSCVRPVQWFDDNEDAVFGDVAGLKWISLRASCGHFGNWYISGPLTTEEGERMNWWIEVYERLAALDQLFIAV